MTIAECFPASERCDPIWCTTDHGDPAASDLVDAGRALRTIGRVSKVGTLFGPNVDKYWATRYGSGGELYTAYTKHTILRSKEIEDTVPGLALCRLLSQGDSRAAPDQSSPESVLVSVPFESLHKSWSRREAKCERRDAENAPFQYSFAILRCTKATQDTPSSRHV
jgi:hypothetical protein